MSEPDSPTGVASRGAFVVVKRPGFAAAPQVAPAQVAPAQVAPAQAEDARFRPGWEERSGRGAIGVTIGILGGYAAAFLWLVPLFGKGKDTTTVFLMTFTVMAAMVGLGVAGYFLTRRKAAPGGPA